MNTATINGSLALDYAGSEAMNTICSNLSFSGHNIKKIVVTSCEANDGKSFVAIQIMANLARRGKKVMLVDADLRCSVLNSHYNIQLDGKGMGLAHYLSGQCGAEEIMYATNLPNAYLIPIGTDVQNPLALLDSAEFGKLIETLGETFDAVIVDAPPVGLVIDAAEIAGSCDGSILVLEYNKTHRRELLQCKAQMEKTGKPVLGCVLNKVSFDRLSGKRYYYKYKYGGKYGYGNKYYARYAKNDDEKA